MVASILPEKHYHPPPPKLLDVPKAYSPPLCLQAIMSMRQQGLVKGGTDACAIVGYGDRWYEPQRVRFMDDEPVRHKMLDLIVSGDI